MNRRRLLLILAGLAAANLIGDLSPAHDLRFFFKFFSIFLVPTIFIIAGTLFYNLRRQKDFQPDISLSLLDLSLATGLLYHFFFK